MFCENCGHELKEDAKFCKNCGAKVKKLQNEIPKNSNADEILQLKQLFDNNIITQEEFEKKKTQLLNEYTTNVNTTNANVNINNRKNKNTKHSIFFYALIYSVVILIFAFVAIAINSPTTPESNKNQELLVNEYSLSQEDANNIINIINECGYSKYYSNYKLVKSIGNDEIQGAIGFEISIGDNIIGSIDIKDGKVCLIQYNDKILYENGSIQHTLSEYLISQDEKAHLISITEQNIKSVLKSPSSAKFPWNYDEWNVGKKDGSTIVQGYVDSQNGFGAMIRSEFQITYTNGVVTSLIFDGTEYIK